MGQEDEDEDDEGVGSTGPDKFGRDVALFVDRSIDCDSPVRSGRILSETGSFGAGSTGDCFCSFVTHRKQESF